MQDFPCQCVITFIVWWQIYNLVKQYVCDKKGSVHVHTGQKWMLPFSCHSVLEIQNFFRLRRVLKTGQWKLDLVSLCQAPHEISIEIDPDGFLADREGVIGEKLQTSYLLNNIYVRYKIMQQSCNSSNSHMYFFYIYLFKKSTVQAFCITNLDIGEPWKCIKMSTFFMHNPWWVVVVNATGTWNLNV